MDATAEKFIRFTTDIAYEDLSEGAIHAAKRSIVDSVGCAIGAFQEQPCIALRSYASQTTATSGATIFGTKSKTSPEVAALVNGTMIRYLDFSDDYFGGKGLTGPHPSDNIGGVLAIAESIGGSAKEFLLGVVVAYEACGQLAAQVDLGPRAGWDYPVLHAVGSALGAAKVLHLSADQTLQALGMAVIPNNGLRETRHGEISNWKGIAGPNGSRNGIFSSLLAKEGITGPPAPFEGLAGFMKVVSGPFEVDSFGSKDTRYRVEDTFLKALPVRYTLQLPIWMALELRGLVGPDEVESVTVYLSARDVFDREKHPALWNPRSRETADHSGPYLIGAAMIDGKINAQTFTEERFRDAEILRFTQKISMLEDPGYTAIYPSTFKSRFEVTLTSGEVRIIERENPKGHPANPMSDEEIELKFYKLVDGIIPQDQATELLRRLWQLEDLEDLSILFSLMFVS
jgi:2-methylcitrate dehydratase